ncbi:MAG TPA: DUF4403 family protein, partial [Chryseolinea sp.]
MSIAANSSQVAFIADNSQSHLSSFMMFIEILESAVSVFRNRTTIYVVLKSFCYLIAVLLASGTIVSCTKIAPPAPERTTLDSTLTLPGSELIVPIYHPIQELEDMANEKLGAEKIIEAKLAISEKEDSLFLSISRFQPLKLEYDGDHGITYTLPVQIVGFIDSKVIGIKIKNKEAVTARVTITLFSDLYLDNDWNLVTKTELREITWVEEPKIKIAGIKFNLKPAIQKALEKNKQKIVDKLDASAKDMIKIRQSIEKLWGDIQKPIRINKKVVPVWLKADATDIDGRLFSRSRDTLMIEARLNATLRTVLDSTLVVGTPGPLPQLKRKVDKDPGLSAYAMVNLPFATLNKVVSQVTDTMKFKFKGHSVHIQSSEIYGTKEGLAIRISLRGDVKADVFLKGTIGFDSLEKKVVIENFGFDLNSEQSLLSAADWFAHDV